MDVKQLKHCEDCLNNKYCPNEIEITLGEKEMRILSNFISLSLMTPYKGILGDEVDLVSEIQTNISKSLKKG